MNRLVGGVHMMLTRLFDDWVQEILRPVVVTVLTGCVIFAGSLTFRPIRWFLFPPAEAKDYPLYCTAEEYIVAGDPQPKIGIDFYIINRTGVEQTFAGLEEYLTKVALEDAPVSPVIHIRYSRIVGRIERIFLDSDFNEGKGEIDITHENGDWRIVPRFIGQRAVMKVSVVVVDLPSVSGVSRAAKSSIPLDDVETYERACYSR